MSGQVRGAVSGGLNVAGCRLSRRAGAGNLAAVSSQSGRLFESVAEPGRAVQSFPVLWWWASGRGFFKDNLIGAVEADNHLLRVGLNDLCARDKGNACLRLRASRDGLNQISVGHLKRAGQLNGGNAAGNHGLTNKIPIRGNGKCARAAAIGGG